MVIPIFQNTISWKLSRKLVKPVYQRMVNCRNYGFRDQFQRPSVSINNNNAKGLEMMNKNQFNRLLLIANDSYGEVMSMSVLAVDLSLLSEDQGREIFDLSGLISKPLMAFIGSINAKNRITDNR